MEQIIISICSALICFGIFYGTTNNRIKVLEDNHKDSNLISQRLAILETKIDLLLNSNIYEKNSKKLEN